MNIMGDADKKVFKVGSRKSQLALIQTNHVIDILQHKYPHYEFKIVEMNTVGDKILDKPLPKIGEKSLFTKELEEALENGDVDFVVHSLKDLPTILPDRKIIGAVLERLDPGDCVILQEKHKNLTLETLPKGCVIGTSSLRRTAQLRKKYPDLKVSSIRGNLNTRLLKLNQNKDYDAIVLAVAGVKRMGWEDKISEFLGENELLYAVGQGALAVECQENNYEVLSMLSPLIHRETLLSVIAERSFLRELKGGCSAPVAVNSIISNNNISLTGLVSSLDGTEEIKKTEEVTLIDVDATDNHISNGDSGEPPSKRARHCTSYCGISPDEPRPGESSSNHRENLKKVEALGIKLGKAMISEGAERIMAEARKQGASTSAS